jgi:hypothetical protein
MFTELIKITHTQKDKAELVSINLLKELGETVANIIEAMDNE